MEEIEVKFLNINKDGLEKKLAALGATKAGEYFYRRRVFDYPENKRTRWVKSGIEFDIDTWPELEPYLEIEAQSWEKVDEAIVWLSLNPEDKKIFSTHQIYKLKGINELEYQRIAFDGLVKK
mgnify:CR=1 FL=1